MFLHTLKRVFPVVATVLMLAACSSSKNATTTVSRNTIKGNWVLDRVTYDGNPGGLKITLLDEGSEACLIGSTWALPNNGYGSYSINQTSDGCISGQRNIVWSYQKDGDQPIFQYKRLESGEKAKNIADGYRFRIISADASTMVLQSEVNFEGKPIYINYSFTKN